MREEIQDGPQGVLKPGILRLQAASESKRGMPRLLSTTSISCKLRLRPEMDSGNGLRPFLGDAHVAACGYIIEGLRPFDASQRG